MKIFAYIMTVLGIVATFGRGVYAMGETVTVKGLLILLVVMIPLLFGLWVLSRTKEKKSIAVMSAVLILLSLAGMAMLYDAFFLHPDAQSGLVFFVLPVYQFPVILIATAAVFFRERKK